LKLWSSFEGFLNSRSHYETFYRVGFYYQGEGVRLLILLTSFGFSGLSFAISDFKCTVNEVYKLTDSGLLSAGKGFVTPDVGSEFVVNGQSGQITGSKITNTMSGFMPRVYNYLEKEKMYKAITLYKPHFTIDLLEIHQQIDGKKKPYIYKGAFGEVVTGTCTVI